MMDKTRNILEGLVREGSFGWILSSRSSFDEEFEEMSKSPSGRRKWIPELSPMANVIVGRCSRYVFPPLFLMCFILSIQLSVGKKKKKSDYMCVM